MSASQWIKLLLLSQEDLLLRFGRIGLVVFGGQIPTRAMLGLPLSGAFFWVYFGSTAVFATLFVVGIARARARA